MKGFVGHWNSLSETKSCNFRLFFQLRDIFLGRYDRPEPEPLCPGFQGRLELFHCNWIVDNIYLTIVTM